MPEFIHGEETHALLGACFEVYRDKGCGFLKAVFQECLELELIDRKIPFKVQPQLRLEYKGHVLKQSYQPDFVCYDKIVLEIKAVEHVMPIHKAQLMSYLKATNCRLGLLINFNEIGRAHV